MSKRNFIEESRCSWFQTEGQITDERIQIGCLQRIANSLEQMNTLTQIRSENIKLKSKIKYLQSKLDSSKP